MRLRHTGLSKTRRAELRSFAVLSAFSMALWVLFTIGGEQLAHWL